MSTKSRFGSFAELQILENVDEIEVRKLRGAPGQAPRADTRARWGASASKLSTKLEFGGFAVLQVVDNVDEIVVESLRGAPGRALNEDTRARWGALAPIERLAYI